MVRRVCDRSFNAKLMEEFDELDVIRASELQENENQARRRMLSGGYTRLAQTTKDPSVTVESLESKLDAMQRTLLHIGNQLGIRLIEAETSRQTHSVTHSTAMENFIEFPVFDGASGDLKQWILWLEDFFVRERFTAMEKMNLAQSLLEGKAEVWFYRNQEMLPFQSWEELKYNLWLRFGDITDYDRLLQEQRVEQKKKRMKTTSIPAKNSIWETETEALVPTDTISVTNLIETRDSLLATISIQEANSDPVMDGGEAIANIQDTESSSSKESIEKDDSHEPMMVKVEGDTTMFPILDSLEEELIIQNQVHVSKLEHSLQVHNESPNVCEHYQDVVECDELSKEENLLSGLSQISQVWEPGGVFKLKEPVGLVNQKKSRCLKASMFNFKRKKKRIKRWFNTLSCRESWRKPKHERLLCNLCNLRTPRGLGQLILDDLKLHMRHKWKSKHKPVVFRVEHLRAVFDLQTSPPYALDVVNTTSKPWETQRTFTSTPVASVNSISFAVRTTRTFQCLRLTKQAHKSRVLYQMRMLHDPGGKKDEHSDDNFETEVDIDNVAEVMNLIGDVKGKVAKNPVAFHSDVAAVTSISQSIGLAQDGAENILWLLLFEKDRVMAADLGRQAVLEQLTKGVKHALLHTPFQRLPSVGTFVLLAQRVFQKLAAQLFKHSEILIKRIQPALYQLNCFIGSLWEKKIASLLEVVCVLTECMMHKSFALWHRWRRKASICVLPLQFSFFKLEDKLVFRGGSIDTFHQAYIESRGEDLARGLDDVAEVVTQTEVAN